MATVRSLFFRFRSRQEGLTKIELLVVLALIALLFIMLLLNIRKQTDTARDAQRKADLETIKIAFEEYFNDNGCYPSAGILDNCGSQDLSPYLGKIPCDPTTNQPYLYQPALDNQCTGYRVLSRLRSPDVFTQLVGESCGFTDYNYGISSRIPVAPDDCQFVTIIPSPSPIGSSPTPTPTPSVTPSSSPGPFSSPYPSNGVYACDPEGACNLYLDPINSGCAVTFDQDQSCQDSCHIVSIRCTQ